MKSDNVPVRGNMNPTETRGRKPWKKPSVEIVALESAQGGHGKPPRDNSGHFTLPRS